MPQKVVHFPTLAEGKFIICTMVNTRLEIIKGEKGEPRYFAIPKPVPKPEGTRGLAIEFTASDGKDIYEFDGEISVGLFALREKGVILANEKANLADRLQRSILPASDEMEVLRARLATLEQRVEAGKKS